MKTRIALLLLLCASIHAADPPAIGLPGMDFLERFIGGGATLPRLRALRRRLAHALHALPSVGVCRALRKLRQLDAAATVEDLRNPPGNRLEILKGDQAGQMSIRINDQWRICFRWSKRDAEDVEIVDYHG